MVLSDSELVRCLHRRAHLVIRAGVAALNAHDEASALVLSKLAPDAVHEALLVAVLRFIVLSLGRARGLFESDAAFAEGRLFAKLDSRIDVCVTVQEGRPVWVFPPLLTALEPPFHAELALGLTADGVDFAECPPEVVGNLYELLLVDRIRPGIVARFELSAGAKRKQTGTFFTPRALTDVVVARALEPLERRIRDSAHVRHDVVRDFRVCDPAVGGGAFLLQVARRLITVSERGSTPEHRRMLAARVLYGVDLNATAVAVAEAALCLFVADEGCSLAEAGRNLRVGDALVGAPFAALVGPTASTLSTGPSFDFLSQFPEVFEHGGFDLVIGNPPWVAYAGRAAQFLDPARKAYFAAHYSSLKGYPTLHSLFVERSLQLAPQGTVALVVPSPIADLDGYRAVRRAVRRRHTPCEPMLEFGQDAFESVTQPCFALIAEASNGLSEPIDAAAPFRLVERTRAGVKAVEVAPPAALAQIAKRPALPRELFGEMGFQTTSSVTQHLLLRASEPDDRHNYPLLQGRDVREFVEGEPRLFLSPDVEALAKARCRLRPKNDYERVRFVVRQTARYPIAALHRGQPFRNSLLAGFEVDGLPPDLIVGLLNSSLYRALHVSLRRDARQATFPQVKIAHLRALPAPPADAAGRARISAISAELTRAGVDSHRTQKLDEAVFQLFAIEPESAREVLAFFALTIGR